MKLNLRKHKKAIAIVTAVAVLAGGAAVFLRMRSGGGDPVYVYPFEYLGMTEYWGDSQESYGPVSSDRMQTVFLSETQTVTSIKVAQGDTVKKGDLLMTYDTTLTDISVERKRLAVERLKLQQENARKRLQEIKAMVPMATPAPTVTPNPDDIDLGTELTEPYAISENTVYDGSSREAALICRLGESTDIDDTVLAALHHTAEAYQAQNNTEPPLPSESPVPSDKPAPSDSPAPDATAAPVETPVPTPVETPVPSPVETPVPNPEESPTPETSPTPTEPPAAEGTDFYVVFKVNAGNLSLAPVTLWQGMHVTCTEEGGYSFKFYDASDFPDHTLPVEEEEPEPTPPPNSGYTAAQIAQMRIEQEQTINDLAMDIRMAESEYQLMKLEADNGNIYAEIDGEVVSLLTEEQARMEGQPLLKVSGGGGFYVDGSVSELELANLKLGQEVTVNDWNTGMTYTGTIESVGSFPDTEAGWNGMGNPNASFFPFRVFIDGSADLQTGRYVSVMYSTATSENGIYLQNPFVRTEQGSSYVYVMGSGDRLEKRTVVTGKNLWGSYTEILSGLTSEDLIAFPYGKNVREGAKAVESDYSTLYE